MIIVEQALLDPGCCCLTRTATGPFIDTLLEDEYGNRLYIAVGAAVELGGLVGLRDPVEVRVLEGALDVASVEMRRLYGIEDEHQRLRGAVKTTLAKGAVVKERELGGGEVTEFGLRPKPGERKVEV